MTGFILSIVLAFTIMLVVSRWRLWVGVLAACFVFGLLNFHWTEFLSLSFQTTSSLPNWLLVAGVGLIPVLGTIMRESVHLNEILLRLRKRKKLYLIVTPLLFGLLPIPGGALLSCPLMKGVDSKITGDHYVAINLWFRHLLVIVYPLSSSLIIGAQLAGLSIVKAVLTMIPVMLIMLVTGYIFLLKGLKDDKTFPSDNGKKLTGNKTVRTILLFLTAPILHILLSTTLLQHYEQLSFFIAMFSSVTLALISNRISFTKFLRLLKQSKIEQFSLLFLFLLLFLNLVRSYNNLDTVFQGIQPPLYFVGFLAFVLTFISGRIEIALSIVYPFIFSVYEITTFSPLLFMFVYLSLFSGYLISPLHPCMAFSLEYFQTGYWRVFRIIFPLLLIPLLLVSLFFLWLH
jgi:integral membrane protein (TIGR00529 family)